MNENDLYHINALGGSDGDLILSLVSDYINNKPRTYNFSKYGNLADNIRHKPLNYHPESAEDYYSTKMHKVPMYEVILPLHPYNPVVTYDYMESDWDRLKVFYPYFKNIIITLTKKEIPILFGNMFYKYLVDNYPERSKESWTQTKFDHPHLKEYDHPDDISIEDMKLYLLDHMSRYQIDWFYTFNFIVPEEYQKKVFEIKYHDIVYNPELVKDMIGNITGKSKPLHIDSQYDIYLEKQHKLIDTKFPWVRDL